MNPPATKGFHVTDYVIFAAVLAISIAIGLYHAFSGGKQRTTKEFLMGNRNLKTLPVALSILVSFVSAILVLGTPAEMYTRGTQLFMRTIGYSFACVISSLLLVPLFFNLKVTSSFEYLERRYRSKTVKLMGTISMLIGNIFYMGLVMYTPSTALEAATGFPLWGSIVATGTVSTLYTTVGGLKAVIWTDVFQSLVMVGGMLAIVIQGTIKVGGLSRVWELSQEGGRLIFFNFDPDPTQRLSFWSTVIGGMFSTLTIFGIGQTSVQRYCALPTLAQAKRSIYLNIPGLFVVNILASLVGLVVYAYYADMGCDPIDQGYICNSNQLVPYFVIDVLNMPGLPGVFLAVLFSGAMSSMSSSLNAASAVTWEDILKYLDVFGKLKEEKKALVTKLLVIFFGALAMGIAFLAENIGGHVLQASLSFTGATSGPSLGMFVLGALFPWANAKGAVAGFGISLCFTLWLAIGTFVARPYSSTLPTQIHGCNFTYSNDTMSQFCKAPKYSIEDSTPTPWTYTPLNSSITSLTMPVITSAPPAQLEGINQLYGLSFLWYSAIGCGITVVVGLIVSFITGPDNVHKANPLYLVPFCDRMCCCCPRKARDCCHCNVDYSGVKTEDNETEKRVNNNKTETTFEEGFSSKEPLHSQSHDLPDLKADQIVYNETNDYRHSDHSRL